MTPSLGQGACQALEDAATPAACLADAADFAGALARYDQLRRRRTQAITRRSARLGRADQLSWQPATYTLLGKITSGLDIAQKVVKAGDDGAFKSSADGGHPRLELDIKALTTT